jgi:hypothetical protein
MDKQDWIEAFRAASWVLVRIILFTAVFLVAGLVIATLIESWFR